MNLRTGIPASEHAERRERLLERVRRDGLTGYVLFGADAIQYFTGFWFLSNERPVVYAESAGGESAVFVPEFEVERTRAETAFERSSPIRSTRAPSTRCCCSRACSPTSASAVRSAPTRTAIPASSATRGRR